MTHKVKVDLIRSSIEKGQINFTTNYNKETVSNWLNDDETLPYDLQEYVDNVGWEHDGDHHYTFDNFGRLFMDSRRSNGRKNQNPTQKFIIESGEGEGCEGDDDYCPYDRLISNWIGRKMKDGEDPTK